MTLLPLRRRSTGPKPPGARVKLRLAWGDPPPVPATLVMPTGRSYTVLGVHGKTITCIVNGADDTLIEPWRAWTWASRQRKAAR
jgi:hypothetical protein